VSDVATRQSVLREAAEYLRNKARRIERDRDKEPPDEPQRGDFDVMAYALRDAAKEIDAWSDEQAAAELGLCAEHFSKLERAARERAEYVASIAAARRADELDALIGEVAAGLDCIPSADGGVFDRASGALSRLRAELGRRASGPACDKQGAAT
jgi:hypothetical protein